MLTNENVHPEPDRPRPVPHKPLVAAGRFLAHYAEMVVAMAAGMVLLHPLWTLAAQGAAPESVLRSVEVDTLVMATAMSVPMVAWMRFRGHSWAPALEMSAAMYAGFVVLYPVLWAGALDDAGVESYGHLLMLLFMLLAMLGRRREYTTGHHDHRQRRPVWGRPVWGRPVWSHWPSLVGLAAATSQIVAGVDTEGVAITVTAAASCYLAAAALGRRWVALAGIVVSTGAVTVSEVAGIPWWVGLAGYAAVLVAVGLARPAPGRDLSDQGLAMLGFGGLAVVALFVAPRLGLALAGLALAGHALWDHRHWRRDDVVPRSMAELCILLDVPIGVAAMVLAVRG